MPATAVAQFGGLGRRAAGALSDQIGDEIEKLLREGVRCAFNDARCIERAGADGKTPIMTDSSGTVITDEKGRPMTDPAAAAAKAGPAQAGPAPAASTHAGPAERPGTGAWLNYDFVPGGRVAHLQRLCRLFQGRRRYRSPEPRR